MTGNVELARYHIFEALRIIVDDLEVALPSARSSNRSVNSCVAAAFELTYSTSSILRSPIRTVHNLSCTGGTLISKCIAAMPNVVVLNEIDLHSPLNSPKPGAPATFTPSDIVALLKQSGQPVSEELVSELFIGNVSLIQKHMDAVGRTLVLRDHSHSHFLTGENIATRASFVDILASEFEIRSIITVRDPLDSWLSLVHRGWQKQFSPSTFEEYLARYNLFLDTYSGIPIIKYEDFIAHPKKQMQKICKHLCIEFFDEFESVFSTFGFSGDSGRSSEKIEARSRRSVTGVDPKALSQTDEYRRLAARLNYVN